ncbi:MAG: 2-oxo acid dehydrogenase subunit E2 [Bacteroidetes bacterium]|nr:MAG: 2-oxo acid dehydrogenase subunit E2 [Bacteroidota bacterium]
MAQLELIMPRMGESVHEATIIKWLKNEGDKIALDEPILEIATDKVDSEIPSVSEGTLIKKLFKEGEVVQVGKAIAVISTSADSSVKTTIDTPTPSAVKTPVNGGLVGAKPVLETASVPRASLPGKFYSPLVRNIARAEGVSIAELDAMPGTGKDGRVTKQDILSYLPDRKKEKSLSYLPEGQPKVASAAQFARSNSLPSGGGSGWASSSDEIIEMDRMRKLIAEHMVMSKRVSPHVTSYAEADVTNIVKWRDRIKGGFEKREGEKITFTPVFVEAVVNAIKDFPMMNVSVDGTRIIVRKNINIGMATALPSGNLIVPVIKNADRLNLLGLTKSVNDFATRARVNKLVPDEAQGGTFTLTNVGGFGSLMGAPIINQPQVAILATGLIKKKPVVIETEFGDSIVIRSMMFLSLSYDHRVVDGMLGGSFLKRVSDYLEKFDINRII